MTEPIRIVEGSWTHTCLRTNTALEFRTVASDWGEPHPPEAVEVCLDCGAEIIEDHPIPF